MSCWFFLAFDTNYKDLTSITQKSLIFAGFVNFWNFEINISKHLQASNAKTMEIDNLIFKVDFLLFVKRKYYAVKLGYRDYDGTDISASHTGHFLIENLI